MNLVFLDLEATVLDDWHSAMLLPHNLSKVSKLLATPYDKVGLMSWAVWDKKDKHTFNTEMRERLELGMMHQFDDTFVWDMQDWSDEFFKHSGKKVSRSDMFELFGKQELLFAMSRCHPLFRDQNVFLVDDRVEHELSWHSAKNNCSVKMLDIAKM